MANDFMKNANKVSLDGEVVSFSDTFPIVDIKEEVVETPIVEEPKKEEKVEETKEVEEETTEPTEETTDEE